MNNIEDYCIEYSKKESHIVSKIKKFTYKNEEAPQMISGEIVGNFLKMLIPLMVIQIIGKFKK